jgi:hypothetical protein
MFDAVVFIVAVTLFALPVLGFGAPVYAVILLVSYLAVSFLIIIPVGYIARRAEGRHTDAHASLRRGRRFIVLSRMVAALVVVVLSYLYNHGLVFAAFAGIIIAFLLDRFYDRKHPGTR